GPGNWSADGSGLSSVPSDKTLTSPPLTVTRQGQLQLRFDHRYSFEFDGSIGWDGGQVQISVNDSPFVAVDNSAFLINGYNRLIQGIASLYGQPGFNGDSAGYANARNVTSVAGLGFFNGGELVRVRFVGAWDEFTTGAAPNWLIDQVQIQEGLPGGSAVTFRV